MPLRNLVDLAKLDDAEPGVLRRPSGHDLLAAGRERTMAITRFVISIVAGALFDSVIGFSMGRILWGLPLGDFFR